MPDNQTNDLLWIIDQNDEEIDFYLAEVSKDQFKTDVKHLVKRLSDKGAIKEAIKKLKELL